MYLLFYRLGNSFHRRGIPILPKICTLLGQVVFGAYVPSTCTIGSGTKLAYGGSGVVVHASAVIGNDCLISPGVVIGGRSVAGAIPNIGNRVKLFPGAKVVGKVRVGDDAKIGPNALVVKDVAPGVTMIAPLAVPLESSKATDGG
ncbi:serine O-acetyltransferase [Paenarthrobacter aurescens]|uniref:Serine acetyltransferase n=1 Tax=Paenarthrobacter aurescens TaxID=43663 RepID=A0A4Y3NF77_PAEAU|nr:hypothetical protein [Paenarthrobacter aurescens]MDO6148389.1 hypothetical protein [Paenarthrobacter aurescens]MDO6159635.1 hypothetical protein [Paenarthrobacter aurescens]MDO6164537.1 hypothetical protein [Paenarthrobacter aurescens]GEB17796.1 hypothetical protein AAU01_05510 [Paenarthrobacter aurescens]